MKLPARGLLWGLIGLGVMLASGLLRVAPAQAATFVVDSVLNQPDAIPGDGNCSTTSNVCTLYAAIQEANLNNLSDTINFDLGNAVPTNGFQIHINSPLPPLTEDGTTIDARSARLSAGLGYEGPPIVVLNGTPVATSGLIINSANNVIIGFSIIDFPEYGILISGSDARNNHIRSNFIGVRDNSLSVVAPPIPPPTPLPNDLGGIAILDGARNNIIGITAPPVIRPTQCDLECNVISGNGGGAVLISDAGTNNNMVNGNFIGTDAAGAFVIGNSGSGVLVQNNARRNSIKLNLIAGSRGDGVRLQAGGRFHTVSDNYIGTDVTGTITNVPPIVGDNFGNSGSGISILGGSQDINLIDNVISGNGGSGIHIDSIGSAVVVVGNEIGTDASGSGNLGNLLHGIHIQGNSGENVIGRPAASDRNTIAYNSGDGIRVEAIDPNPAPPPYQGVGNYIQRNSIHSNGGIGIQLILSSNAEEPTLNDALDADGGPNHRQNYPVLTTAYADGMNVEISGMLVSRPGQPFTLEFYSNLLLDCAAPEGRTYIGSRVVTTDAGGSAFFTETLPAALTAGECITAVAIGRTEPPNTSSPRLNTSEFSAPVVVVNAPDIQITKSASRSPVTVGETFIYVLTVRNIGRSVAPAVQVMDTVPTGVTINTVTTDRGTCTNAARTVTCDLDDMTPADTAQIIIIVQANIIGSWANNASVTATGDINPTNNTASVSVTIQGVPTATNAPPAFPSLPPLPTGSTREPSPIPLNEDTNTPLPTSTPIVTSTTVPSVTPVQTNTPVRTATPLSSSTPLSTSTPVPTSTLAPTLTPFPTSTPVLTSTPLPTFTPAPTLTPFPTATTAVETELEIDKEGESLGTDENGIETFNIAINVNNEGSTTFTDVTIIESLLPGVTVVDNQPTCSRTQNTIACGVGTLIGGGRARVNFTVQSQGVNPLLGQTRVETNQGGTVLDDPYLVKFASPPFALPGDEVTWTIYVINPGSSAIDNITVRDVLPASLEVLDADATRGQVSITRTGILFRVSRLNAVDSITITARTRIQETSPSIMTNNACLTTGTQTIPECASAQLYRVDQLPRTGETPSWVRMLPPFLGFMMGLIYYLVTHRNTPNDKA